MKRNLIFTLLALFSTLASGLAHSQQSPWLIISIWPFPPMVWVTIPGSNQPVAPAPAPVETPAPPAIAIVLPEPAQSSEPSLVQPPVEVAVQPAIVQPAIVQPTIVQSLPVKRARVSKKQAKKLRKLCWKNGNLDVCP